MMLPWGKVCPLHGIRFQTIAGLVETNTDQQNDSLPFDHSDSIRIKERKNGELCHLLPPPNVPIANCFSLIW